MNSVESDKLEEWYDLLVDGQLLASIKGRHSAEWFLAAMTKGLDGDYQCEVVRKDDDPLNVYNAPTQPVKPW